MTSAMGSNGVSDESKIPRMGVAAAAALVVEPETFPSAHEAKWAEGTSAAPTNTGRHTDAVGIFVNSHFDSGNIEVVDIEEATAHGVPHEVLLRIHEDPYCEHDGTTHFQYFYYRVSGAKGEELVMRMTNAGKASFPEAFVGYKAYASYDCRYWFKVPTTYGEDSGVLTLRHTPKKNAVYYAYYPPYTYQRHQDLIAEMQTCEGCELEMLGETLDGHDLDLLRVGEPGEGKRNIWIVARQHPGEAMAEWFTEGLLRRLVDQQDPVAQEALKKAVFWVVPNMNPDGSWRGHLRVNAAGMNLNREWREPSMEESPEVFVVKRRMEEVGVDFLCDVHGDEALPYAFTSGIEGVPSFMAHGGRLKKLQEAFADAFVRSSNGWFQTERGYGKMPPNSANLSFCKSYFAEKHGALAMTLELPFKDLANAPDPVQGFSPQRAIHMGATLLPAILEVIPQLR